jgi:MSHA biogenesis protein MshL
VQQRAIVRDSARLCSKLLRNKDFHSVRRAWVWCCVPVVLAATAGSAGQHAPVRLPELAVTRLQGARPASSPPAGDVTSTAAAKLPPLTVTQLDDRHAVTNLDGPRRITLSVSRPMPIGDLLLLLVNGTPFSLVTDNEVGGSFTGDLKELTMRQALEAVLFPRGLDYDVQGTLVRVFPRRTSTRLFTVNYLNLRRTFDGGVTSGAPVGASSAPATKLATTSSADFYTDIESGVQSLLSPSGRVHIDRTAGLVQVTDFAERLDQVGVYLEAAQVRAARQVRIDAQVLSIDLWPGGAASIDWTTPAMRSATAARSPADTSVGLSVNTLDALTKALAEQGVVTKVAMPHIVVMNNEPAVVRVGTALDGLTLHVLAQVSADDFVQLHVSPAYTAQHGEVKERDGIRVPILSVNQADTLMRVRDGDTIVLAGFLNATEKSAPRNGFARLLGGESRTTVRSEVVILLRPRILKATSASPN